MKQPQVEGLRSEIVRNLWTIFVQHRWIEDPYNLFNRFCQTLSFLSDEQQDLIIELTRDYLKIDLSAYNLHITESLLKIQPELFDDVDNIFIMPLLKRKDYGKPKSATAVAYLFRQSSLTTLEIFNGRKLTIVSKPESLPNDINDKSCKILLVDDFIGSGETAESSVNYLINDRGILREKLVIISLVVQEEGYARVVSTGVNIYYSVVRARGISDKYADPPKSKFLQLMTAIEDMLSVDDDYRFGFSNSEALVTMLRTPNNTFPVYWYEPILNNGKQFISPFPR